MTTIHANVVLAQANDGDFGFISNVFDITENVTTVTVFSDGEASPPQSFGGAKASIEMSSYNDGSSNIFFQIAEVIHGSKPTNLTLQSGIKVRVRLKEMTDKTNVTITTGGGNL